MVFWLAFTLPLQSIAVLLHLEALKDVAFLDVLELGQGDAALKARGNLLGVILETLQAGDRILADDDAVTDQTQLGVAGDPCRRYAAACDGADAGDLVDLADLGLAQGDLADLGASMPFIASETSLMAS